MRPLSDNEQKSRLARLLHDFKNICEKADIDFFLCWGTLLGAVRHNGFIPWDDDVDICVRRRDYKLLRKAIMEDGRYSLVDASNNRDYYWNFARFTDNQNTYIESHNVPYVEGLGIFIDVFIIETAPPVNKREEWSIQYHRLFNILYSTVPTKIMYDRDIRKIRDRIINFYCRIKWRKYDYERCREELLALVEKYDESSNGFVMIPDSTFDINRSIFPEKLFNSSVGICFEGEQYPAPIGYDEVLRITYGNYMELPPVNMRHSHHNFIAYEI